MDKKILEEEIRNYDNGDFDRDDLISLIIDMHNDKIKTLEADNKELVEALDKLARLGNEPNYGNSIGNEIAQKALTKHKPSKGE